MQYQQINDYAKVNALNERIAQLEQGHYSNEVYLIEARHVGDKDTINRLVVENTQLDAQWESLVGERDRLIKKLEDENPIEDEGENERELRG